MDKIPAVIFSPPQLSNGRLSREEIQWKPESTGLGVWLEGEEDPGGNGKACGDCVVLSMQDGDKSNVINSNRDDDDGRQMDNIYWELHTYRALFWELHCIN